MVTRLVIRILLFTWLATSGPGCSLKPVNCPPQCFVYTRPKNFYPEAIKTLNVTVKSVLGKFKKFSLSEDVQVRQSAQLLVSQLDQFGSLTSDLIKTEFLACNNHPCDTIELRRLNALLDKAQEQNFELRRTEVVMQNLVRLNSTDQLRIIDSLRQIINHVGLIAANSLIGTHGSKESLTGLPAATLETVVVVAFPGNHESGDETFSKKNKDENLKQIQYAFLDYLDKTKSSKDSLGSPKWVYVEDTYGIGSSFRGPHNPPQISDTLFVVNSIQLRDDHPQLVNHVWKMGNFLGLLQVGTSVRVEDVFKTDSTSVWARVTRIKR